MDPVLKCPAAGAGGGYVYRCTLEAGHEKSHQPVAYPINNETVGIPTETAGSENT